MIVAGLKLDGLEPDSIADDQPLFGGELGLDSVDALELVVALEREFGVAVPSEEVGSEAFHNVRAMAEWLAPRLPGAAAGPS